MQNNHVMESDLLINVKRAKRRGRTNEFQRLIEGISITSACIQNVDTQLDVPAVTEKAENDDDMVV